MKHGNKALDNVKPFNPRGKNQYSDNRNDSNGIIPTNSPRGDNKDQGPVRTLKDRGNNQEYLLARLAHDEPEILSDYEQGKYPSVIDKCYNITINIDNVSNRIINKDDKITGGTNKEYLLDESNAMHQKAIRILVRIKTILII